jgi:ATP-dependent helicase Lhr and Lhr-like helicase
MAPARTPVGAAPTTPDGTRLAGWMHARGWAPHAFQQEVWAALAQSGLLHATTGSGKTYAVWLGRCCARAPPKRAPGLQVLWLTPMRALAADTTRALQSRCRRWRPGWTRGPAHRRHAQRRARAAGPPLPRRW